MIASLYQSAVDNVPFPLLPFPLPSSVDPHRTPVVLILFVSVEAKDGQRTAVEVITLPSFETPRRLPRVGRVEQRFPALGWSCRREHEGERLGPAVQKQRERGTNDAFTAL